MMINKSNEPLIRTLRGKTPKIGKNVFIAENAVIIGDVEIGDNCSIWYNTVIRGDVCKIEIGDNTNIQDGSILHGTHHKCGIKIGEGVTVGHMVMLHGCTIEDYCLIGMGSTIMDLAHIKKNCFVGAGSLVTEDSVFEAGNLILGRPAKAIRPLKENELKFLPQSAQNYMFYKSWYENKEEK